MGADRGGVAPGRFDLGIRGAVEAVVFCSAVFVVHARVFVLVAEAVVFVKGRLKGRVLGLFLVSLGGEEGILFGRVLIWEAHVRPALSEAPLGVPVVVIVWVGTLFDGGEAAGDGIELAGEVVVKLLETLCEGLEESVLGGDIELWNKQDISAGSG